LPGCGDFETEAGGAGGIPVSGQEFLPFHRSRKFRESRSGPEGVLARRPKV